jgi:1-acyl-sn-glycerol-3-phosphate acyltransferase
MNLFYRVTTFFLRGYFRLFYRFSVYGTDYPYQGKAILASNHTSFLDPPLIGGTWPEEVHFLARASLFHNPVCSWLLSHLNAHPIHGTAQDIESFRLVCKLLQEGNKVVIFPEGERSATGQLQSIKSGIAMLALRMHCPIIPVYIRGTFEAWPRQSRWPKFGTTIVCVFGRPIFSHIPPEMNKKQMQEMITKQVQRKLEELRLWLEGGAKGDLP